MLPKISIVTPTLNAQKVLKPYLEGIKMQDYPKELIEIIIADGGSTDKTVEILKEFGASVIKNPLKTAESGKAAGIRNAAGDFIVLIDSDNIVPTKNWLKRMIEPLIENPKAVASEPWEYTWRKEDGFVSRYCALIGMNDPFVHFLGNYDRMNLLTGKWTEVKREEEDKGDYLLINFKREWGLPTVGANGVVFRSSFIKKHLVGDYLFDIDIMYKVLVDKGELAFIKVKNGIVHTYCESDIAKFAKKQRRRVVDFLFHKFSAKDRDFKWGQNMESDRELKSVIGLFFSAVKNNIGMLEFLFSCIFVFPLIFQSVKGYLKKRDIAWFFHPIACEITLWEYGVGTIKSLFKKSELSRKNWSQ